MLLVVVGFLVAQLNTFFAGRLERKKTVSRALSDLLEIRHQFFGSEQLAGQIEVLVGKVPEHQKSQMRVAFDSMLPKWDELHKRYDESVTTLAALDPLLAFQLRSKDLVRPVMNMAHARMGQDPKAAALVGPIFQKNVTDRLEKVFVRAILKLALKVGPLCWFKTKRLMARQSEIPNEFKELLQKMKAAVDSQNAATPAP